MSTQKPSNESLIFLIRYTYCFIIEQCPPLSSPRNGSVKVTTRTDEDGILYTTEYFCDPGYSLQGDRIRICNPQATVYKDTKAVKRNTYSGEAPLCEGKPIVF